MYVARTTQEHLSTDYTQTTLLEIKRLTKSINVSVQGMNVSGLLFDYQLSIINFF